MTQRTDVNVPTPDGLCPSILIAPDGRGAWPAVIMFMDAGGVRPAMIEMAEHLAGWATSLSCLRCTTDTAHTSRSGSTQCSPIPVNAPGLGSGRQPHQSDGGERRRRVP